MLGLKAARMSREATAPKISGGGKPQPPQRPAQINPALQRWGVANQGASAVGTAPIFNLTISEYSAKIGVKERVTAGPTKPFIFKDRTANIFDLKDLRSLSPATP